MRKRNPAPRLLVVLPALALAGCGHDGGTSPLALTPDQVAGVYEICSLTFIPQGGSPPALDIRGAVMDTSGNVPPVLRIGRTTQSFELEYLKKGDVLRPRFEGSYTLSASNVMLSFSDASVAQTLLLPATTALRFQNNPRRLLLEGYDAYSIPKADYERLAGQSYPNLRNNILGALRGTLAENGCG